MRAEDVLDERWGVLEDLSSLQFRPSRIHENVEDTHVSMDNLAFLQHSTVHCMKGSELSMMSIEREFTFQNVVHRR